MKNPRTRRGFTLAETLVALVLFMLCVGVLGEAATLALHELKIMEVTEGRENDYGFVRQQVLQIQDYTTFLTGGTIMTPLAGNAQWTVVVTPCENTADLFQVDLTMQLAGQDNPGGENVEAQTQTQTLFVLRPAWADSDDTSNILTNVHDQLQQVRTAQQWP